MKKNGSRYCKACGKKLKKNGKYLNGKQRWYCPNCKDSHSFKRKDIKTKIWLSRFVNYLLHKRTQSDYGVHRSTFIRNTKNFFKSNMFIPQTGEVHKVIYLDAIWVNKHVYLIARNDRYVIGFMLCDAENSINWGNFIKQFQRPIYVVCDGQNGMLKAFKAYWNGVLIQRCVFHVWLNVKSKLTLNPKTEAGIALLNIGRCLLNVEDKEASSAWIKLFMQWKNEYYEYVIQKSKNDDDEWFTHARLRSCAAQLLRLIANGQLFSFLQDKDRLVNRTNNPIEGGINSPLRSLLNSHRGMRFRNQQKLIEIYLLKRSEIWSSIAHIFAT